MRNRYIAVSVLLVFGLALLPAAQAVSLSSWDVEVSINSDGSADWTVTLAHKEPASRIDYWVLGGVSSVRGTVDGDDVGCAVTSPELGSSIMCPVAIAANQTAVLTFSTPSMTRRIGTYYTFRYNFALTEITSHFSLKISIPKGASLVPADKLVGTGLAPFEPGFGREGTDGQRIYVVWDLQNPKLGEGVPAAVIFEQFTLEEIPMWAVALILAIAAIAGFVVWTIYKKRKGPESVLDILTDAERRVMELLLERGAMDQRDVVRSTAFSKAKVSRVVHSLATRGLIQTVLKGRTREIRLLPRQGKALFGGLRSKLALGQLSREQAVEMVKDLVVPWKTQLDRSYKELEDAIGSKSFEAEKWKPITVHSDVQPILSDAIQLSPKLEALIANHNNISKQLNDELKALLKIIWKRVGTRYYGLAAKQPSAGAHRALAENVLHNAQLDDRAVSEWPLCGSDLIKIRGERAVSERLQAAVRTAKELAAANVALQKALGDLHEQLRKYHRLPLKLARK